MRLSMEKHELLLDIFGNNAKSLEILFLQSGLKPCARMLIHPDYLEETEEFCQADGLCIELADFRVLLTADAGRSYSETGLALGFGSQLDGFHVAYISKDRDLAQAAKTAEYFQDHLSLGRILGYPQCCIDAFMETSKSPGADHIEAMMARTKRPSHWNNILTRHFDLSVLSHIPCSFDCHESELMAQERLLCLEKVNPYLAFRIIRAQGSAYVFTKDEGIHMLRDPKLSLDTVRYNGVESTMRNALHHHLINSSSISAKRVLHFS